MIETPTVHVSNQIDHLITLLRDHLFRDASKPFVKKLIFLPQLNLKNNLMTQFVADKKIDVVMGVEFQELGSGIQTLFRWVSGRSLLFPPLDLLALQLESLIEEDNPAFAASLASEFLKFGKFGGEPLEGWQKKLWDKIFDRWNYPYELLSAPFKDPEIEAEIHLFNFPFLPKLYHLFFAKLARYFPIHYYQFSPCREFWSDVATDREKFHLIKRDAEIESYLEEAPPLLANFGKLGRETFRVFEEEDFLLEEHYVSLEKGSALSNLQDSILHFKDTKTKQDNSIRLFSANSKLREVEILYDTLLEGGVFPSDIQVFAPDISDYAPYIEHVFGAEGSPFDFAIRDLPSDPLFESLFLLFSLDRFEPVTVFELFRSPQFCRLSHKETETFRSWIEKSGVKWGVDAAHRKALLPGYLDESESGTWEQAFTHLINNLIFLPQNASCWDLPYLDFSDGELLGKCIALIRSLREDVDHLSGVKQNLVYWADYIEDLFSRYFTVSDEERGSYQLLKEKLQMLRELGNFNEAVYSFSSIKRYLSSILKQKKGLRSARQLQSITFRSLKLGATLSSKWIAILGMSESDYPRSSIRSSLSLLSAKSDFCPLSSDEDRYIFLEILLNAQETLILSYQNVSEEDGKEQPPSLLVQELELSAETHPPYPFHKDYFLQKNFRSPTHFKMAQNFYTPQPPLPFVPEFLHPAPLPSISFSPLEVDVIHLARFAKNPLRYYCNQILNLYFKYEDNIDPEFQLSPLKKNLLFQETLDEAESRGHLPLGRFKEVAMRHVEEERAPEEKVIDLQLENFHVTGILTPPTGEEKKFSERIKYYPLILLHQNDQDALLRYLRYYQVALQTPSPLHPLFADSLLKKDSFDLAKKLQSETSDPYLQAVFNTYDARVIFDRWVLFLQKTFKELL